jgi:hypothetical protein
MKKIISFYAIGIFFLSGISCQQTGTTSNNSDSIQNHQSSTDSSVNTYTKKVDASSTVMSLIKFWKITKDEGDQMRANVSCTDPDCKGKEPKYIDWNLSVYQDILNSCDHPELVIWVPARYRDVDEDRYCQKRNISNDPSGSHGEKGKVKNYLTYIVEVQSSPKTGADPTYYDCVTICPPPTNGNCSSISNVTTKQ